MHKLSCSNKDAHTRIKKDTHFKTYKSASSGDKCVETCLIKQVGRLDRLSASINDPCIAASSQNVLHATHLSSKSLKPSSTHNVPVYDSYRDSSQVQTQQLTHTSISCSSFCSSAYIMEQVNA